MSVQWNGAGFGVQLTPTGVELDDGVARLRAEVTNVDDSSIVAISLGFAIVALYVGDVLTEGATIEPAAFGSHVFLDLYVNGTAVTGTVSDVSHAVVYTRSWTQAPPAAVNFPALDIIDTTSSVEGWSATGTSPPPAAEPPPVEPIFQRQHGNLIDAVTFDYPHTSTQGTLGPWNLGWGSRNYKEDEIATHVGIGWEATPDDDFLWSGQSIRGINAGDATSPPYTGPDWPSLIPAPSIINTMAPFSQHYIDLWDLPDDFQDDNGDWVRFGLDASHYEGDFTYYAPPLSYSFDGEFGHWTYGDRVYGNIPLNGVDMFDAAGGQYTGFANVMPNIWFRIPEDRRVLQMVIFNTASDGATSFAGVSTLGHFHPGFGNLDYYNRTGLYAPPWVPPDPAPTPVAEHPGWPYKPPFLGASAGPSALQLLAR